MKVSSSSTRTLCLDAHAPDPATLQTAASVLRHGGLVAFATETVYGLGADATSDAAVARIFAAKGRPLANPLIAHVASLQMARACAGRWSEDADRLAQHLWPGPLTLVMPRSASLAAAISAGLDTVALRLPDLALAQQLIRSTGVPIAAPSANRSEHVSPTCAQHVLDDLDDRLDLVLDSGPTVLGIESTVVDVTSPQVRVLRRGPIEPEAIAEVLGRPVDVAPGHALPNPTGASPGTALRHYAPDATALRVDAGAPLPELSNADVVITVGRDALGLVHAGRGFELQDPDAAARELYATLRQAERFAPARIVVLMPPADARWDSVRDRLLRATQPWSQHRGA